MFEILTKFVNFHTIIVFLIISIFVVLIYRLYRRIYDRKFKTRCNSTCTRFESIKKRASVRTYDTNYKVDKELLQEILESTRKWMKEEDKFAVKGDENLRLLYIEEFHLDTMLIKGAKEYVAMIGKKHCSRFVLMKAGYMFQKMVLLCKERGLGTCWVGGKWLTTQLEDVLREKKFSELKEDEQVIAMTPVGKCRGMRLFEILTRLAMFSYRRNPRRKIFFEDSYGNCLDIRANKKYFDVFESFRWAPSAKNSQKWHVVKKDDEYHFFTYPSSAFYTNLDIGIGICNWETAAEELGIKGEFVIKEDLDFEKVPKNAKYFATWAELE